MILLTFSFLNISATMLRAVARELAFMALPLIRFSGSAKEAHTENKSLVSSVWIRLGLRAQLVNMINALS